MTLQSSGPIKASEIQAEFGGSNPFRLSDYYAGGPNVPSGATGDGGPIPSSGTIKFSDFYGASDAAPGARVDVIGAILIDINFQSDAGVGYGLFNATGAERSYADNSGSFVTFNTWLLSGVDSDYDCKLTVDSGTNPTGDAVGSWLNLGTTRTWKLDQDGIGQKENSCTIEIRDAVTFDILDSALVTMEVEHIA